MNFKRILLVLTVLTFTIIVAACGSNRPLLFDVSNSQNVISPNADGIDDVTRFSYKLSRSANLSIFLIDSSGKKHYFRNGNRRSIGDYRVDFGGVIDGAMLPDGQYTWVFEAVDDSGQTMREEGARTLQNADTVRPEFDGFSV